VFVVDCSLQARLGWTIDELLRDLLRGDKVLDLGCAGGSFDSADKPFQVVRIDLDRETLPRSNAVQADAAKLPFSDGSFDVVVSNHSLEHFTDLDGALKEVGRVLKANGSLYVAVPDAGTISDWLYRWLARGGGHVNPFRSATDLSVKIERSTGLPHIATRTLCASLSCLNRANRKARAPRRLILLGGGRQISLHFLNGGFRVLDRLFGTRLSVYGWALYFGSVRAPIDTHTWINVCVRCGSGHPSEKLKRARKLMLFSTYRCPSCGTTNLFADDKHYRHLR
jgi:SAM-dependent methyltransferase